MSPLALVARSVWQRRVQSAATGVNVAVGVCLVSVLLLVHQATRERLLSTGEGFSLVVGPPGSRLELVLSTVYQQGAPAGVLPYPRYREIERHSSTRLIVPYVVGDSFRGHRVIGTTDAFFSPAFPLRTAGHDRLARGRPFRHDRALWLRQMHGEAVAGATGVREAVVGSAVARELGAAVGDRIEPAHGMVGEAVAHDEERLWEVVGVLSPTHTALDEVVLTNLESLLSMPEHGGGAIRGRDEAGVSAALVFPRAGVHKALLLSELSKRGDIQVADVQTQIARITSVLGQGEGVLLALAGLLASLGVLSVGLGIHASVSQRTRELCLLRMLGATRVRLVLLVVLEAACLSAFAGAVGLLASHAGLLLGGDWLGRRASLPVSAGSYCIEELWAWLAVVIGGGASGLFSAHRIYRQDVVAGLRPAV